MFTSPSRQRSAAVALTLALGGGFLVSGPIAAQAASPARSAASAAAAALPSSITSQVLRQGARGQAVREIQRLVGSGVDGIFGPRTEAAVRRVQAEAGITVDGIVGPVTWRTAQRRANPAGSAVGESTPSLNLVNDVRALPRLHRGDRGDSVVVLQKYLNVLLKDREVARDGIFGPSTDKALRAFQARHGLTVDGYAGPKTYQSLFEQPGARN